MNQENLSVCILSDATGETSEQTAKAALAQFDVGDYKIRRFSHVRDLSTLERVLGTIAGFSRVIVYYSLVDTHLLDFAKNFFDIHNIIHVDVLTPAIIAIERETNLSPATKPGGIRKLDEHYFKRVEAIEFAVRYDDGKDPRGVLIADLTILGISRTSKTPLSMYLANKKYRVANIPLVPESDPPEEIFQIPAKKIIGLTNSPEKLNQIRKERLRSMGLPVTSSYSNLERILEEIEYAHQIMKKVGCPIVDVSNRAIEETADIIIRHLKKYDQEI